ncbi:MAG: PfkB family carbohydrate kinase [Candidatus Altiarchaeota archaeon]
MENSASLKLDLLVFGDTCVDYFYEVDKLPKPNEAADVSRVHEFYGGMGANTAVVASRLGLKTGLVSVIGSDAEPYRKYMEAQGVKFILNTVFGDTTRSMFFKNNGENFSFFYKGVTEQLDNIEPGKNFSKNLIRYAGSIYMSRTYTRLQRKVAKLCKQKFLIYNPGYGVFEFTELPRDFLLILRNTNVLVLNQHEFNHLKKLGLKLGPRLGPKTFIITEGAKGCTIWEGATRITIGTYPTKVVDASGAGDAFNAGFITALQRNYKIIEAAKIANATASFVVEKWGCQTNIPNWADVLERHKSIN